MIRGHFEGSRLADSRPERHRTPSIPSRNQSHSRTSRVDHRCLAYLFHSRPIVGESCHPTVLSRLMANGKCTCSDLAMMTMALRSLSLIHQRLQSAWPTDSQMICVPMMALALSYGHRGAHKLRLWRDTRHPQPTATQLTPVPEVFTPMNADRFIFSLQTEFNPTGRLSRRSRHDHGAR